MPLIQQFPGARKGPFLAVAAFAVFLAALACAASLSAGGAETDAQTPTSLAVDTRTDGNTGTSVGTIDSCVSVDRDAEFDVDIIIRDVQDLVAWESPLVYNASVLNVTAVDVRMFQAANNGSNVVNVSDSVPNASGRFYMGAGDINKVVDSGSGVLARLRVRAVGPGVSALELLPLDFNGDTVPDLGPTLTALTFDKVVRIQDTDGDELFDGVVLQGAVAVDQPCPSDIPSPTATTSPPGATSTPAPGQTPTTTPTPDSDDDTIPEDTDQCPDTPPQANVDPSGCSQEQLDELTEETRGQLIDSAAPGLSLTVTLGTVVIGGSTEVLTRLADGDGDPMPDAELTIRIEAQPGDDAQLEGGQAVTKTTDEDGVAQAHLEVGSTPGDIVVSASAEGERETVTVTAIEEAVRGADNPNTGGSESASADGDSLSAWVVGTVATLAMFGAVILGTWFLIRRRSY